MINKAQEKFRTKIADSREFTTWYDNEDVQRLIWQIYQDIPADKKYLFLKPYVFYDQMEKDEATTLDKLLDVCHQILREQNLKFLPFILKPKILPHFYAGFIHINPDYIYIFDPVGSNINNIKFRDCFKVSKSDCIGDLPVIVSSEKIQNTTYEAGLVSCGPLCVEFLDYLMNHPEVVPASGFPSSIISPQFVALTQSNREHYEASIVTMREKHDQYLGQLSDEQLESKKFEEFYQELTDLLLNMSNEEEEQNANSISSSSALKINYSTPDVQHIIRQIYQSIPVQIRHRIAEPAVFDTKTLDKDLPARYEILCKENLNYFPFLFKPLLSKHFYAGLIVRRPTYVYLFIPNGAIPGHEKLETHLGLSTKFFIGQLPLLLSLNAQTQLHLPNNSNVSTLLSIEFLKYIMQHDKTYENPSKFLELLKIHSNNYQAYINKINQKHREYLQSTSSSQSVGNQTKSQTASQIYLEYFENLAHAVSKAEQKYNHLVSSPALKLALSEARFVLNELRSFLPVNPDQRTTLVSPDSRELLHLADLCSHVTQGLNFIMQNQVSQQVEIFCYTQGQSGHLHSVYYDLAKHKKCMQRISDTALLLPGAGWHQLKKALFILAGAMLSVCGMLLVTSSTPISASLLLTLAGTATLSAGIGFFVGRDTGLASAANNVKMQPANENSLNRHSIK